jgi:hypothetical protein
MRNDPFVFHNGRAAHNVEELLAVIEESDVHLFEEHVTKDRNDFAAWVEHSLDHKSLAQRLRTSTDRIATISTLRSYLKPKLLMAEAAHFLEKGNQKEFLYGMAVGIIIGILLFRIVQVLA